MRSSLAAFGKSALVAVFLTLLALPAFAQVGLRRAFDSDGDGKADYYVFRPSNNTWYIRRNNGSIGTQPWGIANEDWLVPGDYDGDGKGDIAIWRETTGQWYKISSQTGTFSVSNWGLPGDEPVARDYDGDGRTDMAIVRRSNGVMTWWLFYSSTNGFESRQFGVPTDFTAPGDYNGDGRYDLAVQRPGATPTSVSAFYIQTATTFEVYFFGFTNDLVAPGDWDGDGRTDLAVVREGALPTDQLQWFYRRSIDGATVGPVNWGVTGTDLLAQNDYDGDGKTEYGIWRNTEGRFYIFNPVNSNFSVINWGEPSDFPVASYDTH